jgi:hypothetical protein
MKKHHLSFASVLVVASLLAALPSALAKPRCDGPYDLTGNLRGCYCKSEYLAYVARDHGMRVTGAELRASYSRVIDVCQLIGNDNRVDTMCMGPGTPLGNPLIRDRFGGCD